MKHALGIAIGAVTLALHGQGRPSECVSATSAANRASLPVAPRSAWTDPSPHREGYVTYRGTRLHYLDWGGPARAETLVFLAGAGQGAHVFDDLAPRFTDCWRPVAITRRGIGPSSDSANTDWSVEGLAADVAAVLDSLGRGRVTLLGHSFAGAEITALARSDSARVARLVYIDATFDSPDTTARPDPVPRPMPRPRERTFTAYRPWLERFFYGFWSNALEADMRATREIPGSEGFRAMHGVTQQQAEFSAHPTEYDGLRVPILAIVARRTLRRSYPWLDSVRDSSEISRAQEYLDDVVTPASHQAWNRLRQEAPTAAIIEMDAPHHIFIAQEDSVVRAIRAFLSRN